MLLMKVFCSVILLSINTLCYINRNNNVPVCFGVECGDHGTLERTTCACICDNGFTGHFCETVMKATIFPRGNYAVMTSLSGCPEDENVSGWKEGYINMTMTDVSNATTDTFYVRHYWSEPIHLLGPYHRKTLQLNFCSRLDQPLQSDTSNNTEAAWPSGNYCVLKVGDTCPSDFKEGSITLHDYIVFKGQYDGYLPEINFTSDAGVTLYFCCHSSIDNDTSETKQKSSFGNSSRFLLLQSSYKENCQNFENLDVIQEMFAFRKTRENVWPSNGTTPYFAEDENFLNISFCYYKPKVRVGCMHMADRGGSYRGNFSTPKVGKRCDFWSTVEEKIDSRFAADLESNFCRKLKKTSRTPMCYVRGVLKSCPDVPVCDDKIEEMDNVALLKPVDSPPGFAFRPGSLVFKEDDIARSKQLVVNGKVIERINFRVGVPVIKPYFKVDLGHSHTIHGVLIHRAMTPYDAESYWQKMALWIGKDEWSFLSFGAYICGEMYNAHKNNYHMFKCDRPITGRYVTLQTNIYSDPDVMLDEYLNLQLNEIEVFGRATKCGRLLGLMTGTVTRPQITTSSFKDGFHGNQSRLNGEGPGWCPKSEDEMPFIKVHLLLPMIVEGVVIQGWVDNKGVLKYPKSFKVMHGFNYDEMDYYNDRSGPKNFYTSVDNEDDLTQKFWFSKTFVASVVGLQIPAGEHSCLKIDWVVCKRQVTQNPAEGKVYGWASLPGINLLHGSAISRHYKSQYNTCFKRCRKSPLCLSFEQDYETEFCAIFDTQHLQVFFPYVLEPKNESTYTYKISVGEITTMQENVSIETLISSPNYPYYYGENNVYTWNVHITDAAALKVDIVDIHIPVTGVTKVGNTVQDQELCFDEFAITFINEVQIEEVVLAISSEEQQMTYQRSQTYVRRGNQILIKLRSCATSRSMRYRGFNIKVSKSDCEGCTRGKVCRAVCGYIQSPFFPAGLYWNASSYFPHAAFRIRANPYDYIRLHITFIDVPEESDKVFVIVDIFGKIQRNVITGAIMPYPIFYSRGSSVTIVGVVNHDAKKMGYQLRYNFERMHRWQDFDHATNHSECDKDWVYFNGSCYIQANFARGTFLESQKVCENLGGDLAIITSLGESNAINYYLMTHENRSDADVVIGLRVFADIGVYKWIDDSKAIFQNWHTDWMNVNNSNPGLMMTDSCVVLSILTSQNSSNWILRRCRSDYENALCEKRLVQENRNLTQVYLGRTIELTNKTMTKATFKCTEGSHIDVISNCDRYQDCLDNSDETNCEYKDLECGIHEFQCENTKSVQCIPMSRYCDYIDDCADFSDELTCIRPNCMVDEFRCTNGQCISNEDRCDIKVDCFDGSDEMNCEEVDCTHSGKFFQCEGENMCIPMSKVCDGFADCQDESKSDESNCRHIMVKENCEQWYADGFRKSGTYIIDLANKLSDGENDGSLTVECEFDEFSGIISTVIHHTLEATFPLMPDILQVYNTQYDLAIQSSLNPNQNFVGIMESFGSKCLQKVEVECFQAPDMGDHIRIIGLLGIPPTSCRLYRSDCLNKDGIPMCNVTSCKCLLSTRDWLIMPKNTWFKDVFEIDNPDYLPIRTMRNRGAPFPGRVNIAVGPLVCNSTMLKSSSKIKCNNGKVVPASARCIYKIDSYGSVTGCRDNTHLLDCDSFECPNGYVKCPGSFCIPLNSVCDDQIDCKHGEDEDNCQTWTCPNNYKCRDSKICIPFTKVCDGLKDCILGDDETHCNSSCPSLCTCVKGHTDCSALDRKFRNLRVVSKDTRKLNLSYNQVTFNDDNSFFAEFDQLAVLGLAHCKISVLPGLIFLNLKNLQKLDLSFNKLSRISRQSLFGLENLRELKLHGNFFLSELAVGAFRSFRLMKNLDLSGLVLEKIAEETFVGMNNLEVLNISYNKIDTVEDNAFKHLQSLNKLDMQHNVITSFGKDSFADLNSLQFLYTDSFMFCCIKPSSLELSNCHPPPNAFSSCSDLLRNQVLRAFIWIIGAFAFFGNILSLVFRFLSENETFKCGYGILVTNLSLADMLMGVYLLIISIADVTYRGRYIWNDTTWRNSTYCSFVGGLAIVSIESSVLILTLITFDRFKSIKFMNGYTGKKAIYSCIPIWIGSVIVAIIPVLPVQELENYFGESFYSVSGVCLTLPLTTERLSGWNYSAGVFIVFNFVCFVCILIGQSIIYVTVIRTKIMLESPDRRIEFQAAKRLSTIVITDFLAWLPVCAFGANALYGSTVSGDVYTWIAVVVMPLKSALNPILFTYSTFSNSKMGRRVLDCLGFQTSRFSTGRQVSAYLQNVHQIYKMKCLVLHKEKNHQSLKEFLTSVRNVPMVDMITVTARMAYILDKIHDMDLIIGRFGSEHVIVKPGTNKVIRRVVLKGLPREAKDDGEKSTNVCDFGSVIGWMLKRYKVQRLQSSSFRGHSAPK